MGRKPRYAHLSQVLRGMRTGHSLGARWNICRLGRTKNGENSQSLKKLDHARKGNICGARGEIGPHERGPISHRSERIMDMLGRCRRFALHRFGSFAFLAQESYSAGWIAGGSSFLISLQMKSPISMSER